MGSAPKDVPEEIITQAKAAFARRSKSEIAVLAWDSLVDEDQPPWDHRLRFEHPQVQIDLHILASDAWLTIEGRVTPPVPSALTLESDAGNVLGTGDVTDGAFTLAHVSPGLVRLCLSGSDQTSLVCTDWFRI
jgi:hypothetical protein